MPKNTLVNLIGLVILWNYKGNGGMNEICLKLKFNNPSF